MDSFRLSHEQAEQLARYWSGECSPDEAAAIDAWITDEPARAMELANLRDAWDLAGARGAEQAAEAFATRITAGLDATERKKQHNAIHLRDSGKRPAKRGWIAGLVATAAIALAVMLGSIFVGQKPHGQAYVYHTAVGQRTVVNLANGSRVTLGPLTTLHVQTSGEKSETIDFDLTGEAYFSMTHRPNSPVSVRTSRGTIRVLGTEFGVRQHKEDTAMRVTVNAGRVQVASQPSAANRAASPRILEAGMIAWVAADSTTVLHSPSDVADGSAWTTGHLSFHRTPVREVLQSIERWYNLRFVVADSILPAHHVTATLDYGTTADLLSALSLLLDVSVSQTSAVGEAPAIVTLRPRGTPHAPTRNLKNTEFTPTREVGR